MNMRIVLVGSVALLMVPLSAKLSKTELVRSDEPSVVKAMDIKNSILVPLDILEQKYENNELVDDLEDIAEDIFKLSLNKVAVKYSTFIQARNSFEQGLEASEFKFAYLKSWIELVDKRLRKVDEYKDRLDAIAERLDTFDNQVKAIKDIDEQLRTYLMDYSVKIRQQIEMTNTWLNKSRTVFKYELNRLKSREKRFEKAQAF
jgi:small-conductance mechanosensitive channel